MTMIEKNLDVERKKNFKKVKVLNDETETKLVIPRTENDGTETKILMQKTNLEGSKEEKYKPKKVFQKNPN